MSMGLTDGKKVYDDWRDAEADDRNDERAFQEHMGEAKQIGVALFEDQ